MKNWVICLYIVFWIILSEILNMERIIIGSVLCLGIFLFNKKIILNDTKSKGVKGKKVIYGIYYILFLIREIFKSNFHVAKLVLSPKMKISPQIFSISTKLKSDFYKTILANSITLTPGTLTLELNNDKLIIHCLEKENVKVLIDSDFEKILLKAEGYKQ
ncbi:Na+/H+ antiporter subunit E [Clostridium rectalis]|uniref:Na+/H+ antiporter subunit E n=1 Tax=Clostridium rectalis TaxID=2040295 RepID=UPI000F6329B0|nr:Na+/H+ antiporter subunit E [Clostridium rectalis]